MDEERIGAVRLGAFWLGLFIGAYLVYWWFSQQNTIYVVSRLPALPDDAPADASTIASNGASFRRRPKIVREPEPDISRHEPEKVVSEPEPPA